MLDSVRFGSLVPVTLEHVVPERSDLLDMAAFAIDWNPCEYESLCELAFQTYLLSEWACSLVRFVFT